MTRIELPGKPLNVNAISHNSFWKVAEERKHWREFGCQMARLTRVKPVQGPVVVHVRQICNLREDQLPDAGANFHAAKGFLDGLVDAKILKDDSPQYVVGVWFHAPVTGKSDSLILELVEDDIEAPSPFATEDADEAKRLDTKAGQK